MISIIYQNGTRELGGLLGYPIIHRLTLYAHGPYVVNDQPIHGKLFFHPLTIRISIWKTIFSFDVL